MNELSPTQIGRYPGIFLLILSGINFALGLVFYVVPGEVIGYWPWTVKDLL